MYRLAQFVFRFFCQLKILHRKHDEDDGAFIIIRWSSQRFLQIIILYTNKNKTMSQIRSYLEVELNISRESCVYQVSVGDCFLKSK